MGPCAVGGKPAADHSRGARLRVGCRDRHPPRGRRPVLHLARRRARQRMTRRPRISSRCSARYPDATVALNIKELGQRGRAHRVSRPRGRRSARRSSSTWSSRAAGRRHGAPLQATAPDDSDRGARQRSRRIDRTGAQRSTPPRSIWLDEFDGPWCTEPDVRRLKDAGRSVYAVSPDLHGSPPQRAARALARLHPLGRRRHLHRLPRGARARVAGPYAREAAA